jgi:hypothetical protein
VLIFARRRRQCSISMRSGRKSSSLRPEQQRNVPPLP